MFAGQKQDRRVISRSHLRYMVLPGLLRRPRIMATAVASALEH